MARATITKMYVRHYRDNGQTTTYVEWSDGARTEGALWTMRHYIAAGFSAGLRLEREVW